ncbi:MAG: hypothetical protein RLN62_04370 [Rickettsiales bacterium]
MSASNQTQTIEVQADGSFEPVGVSAKTTAPTLEIPIPTDPAKVEAAKEIFAHYAYRVDALKRKQADLLFPETADLFLTRVIRCRINDQQKDQQLELAKTAIEKGADVKRAMQDGDGWFYTTTLTNLQSMLLTSETADVFFKLVTHTVLSDELNRSQQLELAKAAIEKGADINKVIEDQSGYFGFDSLYNLQSVLLTPETANKFFSKLLSAGIRDKDKPKQLELLKAAIEMGADINKVFEDKSGYFQLDSLYNLQSVLLTPETANKFLKTVISRYIYEESDKDKQIELAKAAIDKGAAIDTCFGDEFRVTNFHLLEELRPYAINENNAENYLIEIVRHLESELSSSRSDTSGNLICKINYELNNKIKKITAEILNEFSDHISQETTQQSLLGKGDFDALKILAEEFGWEVDCDYIKALLEESEESNESYQGESVVRSGSYFRENPEKLLDLKYRNLNAPASDEVKIPHVMHHIWLTSPDKPRQMKDGDIENAKKTNALLQSSESYDWQQIIWVNDKSILEPSVNSLEGSNIEIREFSEIKEFLPNYDLVVDHTAQKHWGIASDTLRYDLVNHMGGVYADINYEFSRTPDRESVRYDFFSTTFSLSYSFSIDNFMFGAVPQHPVIKTAQETVRKNLLEPSQMLQKLYNTSIASFTDKATADPIGYSYFQAAHQDGNIDVVYPLPADKERDSAMEELVTEEFNEDFVRLCPELKEVLSSDNGEFESYMKHHEICPIDEHMIGRDGVNGHSWVEE